MQNYTGTLKLQDEVVLENVDISLIETPGSKSTGLGNWSGSIMLPELHQATEVLLHNNQRATFRLVLDDGRQIDVLLRPVEHNEYFVTIPFELASI